MKKFVQIWLPLAICLFATTLMSGQGLLPDSTRQPVQLWLTPANMSDLGLDTANMNAGLMDWEIGRTQRGTTKNSECGYMRIELIGKPVRREMVTKAGFELQMLPPIIRRDTQIINRPLNLKLPTPPPRDSPWVEVNPYLFSSRGLDGETEVGLGAEMIQFYTKKKTDIPGKPVKPFIQKAFQPAALVQVSAFTYQPVVTTSVECTNCGSIVEQIVEEKKVGFRAELGAEIQWRGERAVTKKEPKFEAFGFAGLRYVVAETSPLNDRIENPGFEGLFLDFGFSGLRTLRIWGMKALRLDLLGNFNPAEVKFGGKLQLNVLLGNFKGKK